MPKTNTLTKITVFLIIVSVAIAAFSCNKSKVKKVKIKEPLEISKTVDESQSPSDAAVLAVTTDAAVDASAEVLTFDTAQVGKLPTGWKIDSTRQKGLEATWKVIDDATAPSGGRILAMVNPNHKSSGTFNICRTDKISFLDGEIEVRFKAINGKIDQGGGVIWRVQNSDNYYIARFNPLENNFRIYHVRNSVRTTLADAKIALSAHEWHTLKITQHGDQFEGYLNGKKLLEGKDETFAKSGGVGLWTKADAVTSFDNFTVRPSKK